jgi:hypothetical protein
MRSISLVLILLVSYVHSAPSSRRDRSSNLAGQAGERSVLFRIDRNTGVERGASKCGHIVISEVTQIDSKMMKGTPREYANPAGAAATLSGLRA